MNLIKKLVARNLLLSKHGAPLIISEEDGFLQCTDCGEKYPIKNNAVDFFNDYLPRSRLPLQPPREFVHDVARSLGIAAEENHMQQVALAIQDTTNVARQDFGITSEIRELASRMKLEEPDWYNWVADQQFVTDYPVNTPIRVSILSSFIGGILPKGKTLYRSIRIRNDGDCLLSSKPENGLRISYHWLDANKNMHTYEGVRSPLPRDIRPGEEITVVMNIKTPPRSGLYYLQICPLQEFVSWNENQSLTLEVNVQRKHRHILSNIRHIRVPFDFNEEIQFVRTMLNRYFGNPASHSNRPLLLEIGGGVYPQSLPLSGSQADVISLDISFPMSQLGSIYWSQEFTESNSDHFAFLTANANDALPFQEKIFDGIIICAALHHFADPIHLLCRLKRYLKDDAVFIIVREPCNPNPFDVQYLEDIQKGINEQQFEMAEYAYIFREAGLFPIEACVRSSCSLMVVLKKNETNRTSRWAALLQKTEGLSRFRKVLNRIKKLMYSVLRRNSTEFIKI